MAISLLLVDDDPAARRTIEHIFASVPSLEGLGVRIVQAMDAQKALGLVQTEKPDLLITDLSIPGMDGFAFCREVRRLPDGKALGLVVMSWVYKDGSVIAGMLADLRAVFVAKPLEAMAMAQAIVSALPAPARVVPPLGLTSDTMMAEAPAAPAAAKEPAVDEQGSLADRGVARLLFDHIVAHSTGTLVLRRGQIRKEIFLRDGRAVGADSNLRQEALGALLVAKQIIDDKQLEYLLAETKRRGQKMGSVLVELGYVTNKADLQSMVSAEWRGRSADAIVQAIHTFFTTRLAGGQN